MPHAGPYLTPRRVQDNTASATDTTVPAALSSAPTAGNVMLSALGVDATGRTITVPTGWTAIGAGADEGTDKQIQFAYRVVLPGDGASHTWTISGAAADLVADIIEIENIDPDNPVLVSDYDSVSSATTDTYTLDNATATDLAYLYACLVVDGASTAHTFNTNSAEVTDLNEVDGANIDLQSADAVVNFSKAFAAVADWTTANNSAGGLVALRAKRQYGFEMPKLAQKAVATDTTGAGVTANFGSAVTPGSLLYAYVTCHATAGQGPTAAVAGWTQINAVDFDPMVASSRAGRYAFYKKATAADTSVTVSVSHASEWSSVSLFEFTGVDVDSGPDVAEGEEDNGTTWSITSAASPESDVSLVIGSAARIGLNAHEQDTGIGFTELDDFTYGAGYGASVTSGYMVTQSKHAITYSGTTGSGDVSVQVVSFRAKRQPYKQPVQVQSKSNWSNGSSAPSVTLDSAPTVGNVLVGFLATWNVGPGAVHTAPAGWSTALAQEGTGNAQQISCIYKVVDADDTATVAWSLDKSCRVAVWVEEWANINTADIINDSVKSTVETSTSITLTLSSATSQSAVALLAFGAMEATGTSPTWTNGFSGPATAIEEGSLLNQALMTANRVVAQSEAYETVLSWTTGASWRTGFLLALNAAPMTGYCTPVRVQSANNNQQSAGALTVTLGSAPTVGNLLIGYGVIRGSVGQTLTIPTGWTALDQCTMDAVTEGYVAYKAVDADDTTASVWTPSGNSTQNVTVVEYTGIDTSNIVIESVKAANEASVAEQTAALTRVTDSEPAAIICGTMTARVMDSDTSAFTNGISRFDQSNAGGSWPTTVAVGDRITTSPGTYSTTCSWTAAAAVLAVQSVIVALRPAASPIVRWQEATEIDNGSTSIQATLPQTPTVGNWLVAVGSAKDTGVEPNFTLPAGWTELDESVIVASTKTSYVIAKEVVAGDAAAVSISIAAATDGGGLSVFEYEGLNGSKLNAVAIEAGVSASSQAFDPGVTTTKANTVVLAMVCPSSDITAVTAASTAGFQIVQEETVSAKYSVIVAERIVNAKGTYQPTVSWTTARVAGGVILALGPIAAGIGGRAGASSAQRVTIGIGIGL